MQGFGEEEGKQRNSIISPKAISPGNVCGRAHLHPTLCNLVVICPKEEPWWPSCRHKTLSHQVKRCKKRDPARTVFSN